MNAQSRGHAFELSAGVAPTTQALTSSGALAAVVRLGVVQQADARAYRFRLEGEATFAQPATQSGASGAFRAAGVGYGVIIGPARKALAPYAIAGVGATWIAAQESGAWPGLLLTARTGAGVRWSAGGRQLHIEASAVSVRASRSPLSRRALLWPITLGFAF